MKQSKKWISLALVCSQFLTTIPVSATLVGPEDAIEQTPTEEQKSSTLEDQETRPSETHEETPTESAKPPIEEGPVVPEEKTEEPNPQPQAEDSTPVDSPKEEVKSSPTPKPNQSTDDESKSESLVPGPVENQRPPLSEFEESTPAEPNQSKAIEITPLKETWEFIKEIGEDARKIGLEEDLYGSVMIAQAILESASGQSKLSQAPYHSLFGIKGTVEGNGITFKTQENDGAGNMYTIDATFRCYEDYEASFRDYAKLLKEGLAHYSDFYKGTWKSKTGSYEDATEFLNGRYAADTQYGEKLNAIIEAYALTSYDTEKATLLEGNEEMIYPVMNPIVSSAFGPRGDDFHRGVDFAAPMGTPVYATLAGTVISSGYHESWGNYVAIKHENGLTTLYAHNNQNLVAVGQTVSQGDILASIGSTGNSTGPHLHFEVSLSPSLPQDQLIDPIRVLPSNG